MHFSKEAQDYVEGSLIAPWVIDYMLYQHLGTGNPSHPYWVLGQEIDTRWSTNDVVGPASTPEVRLWRIAEMLSTWLPGSTNGVFPGHPIDKRAGRYWHFGQLNARLRAMLPTRPGEPDGYASRYRHFLQRLETPEGFSLEWSNIYAKDASEWMFHDLTEHDFLDDRETYEHVFDAHNAKRIAEAIRKYKPAVVAMATDRWQMTEALTAQLAIQPECFEVEDKRIHKFYIARTEHTLLISFSPSRLVPKIYLPRVAEEATKKLPLQYFSAPVAVITPQLEPQIQGVTENSVPQGLEASQDYTMFCKLTFGSHTDSSSK
ncbi:MAG: hypothetical protein H7Y37_10760 [Anaerolineae bacterium]|nr:hypothetical protein [Gloeobacterales cyanobacterium ES-bin-313]